MLPTFQVKYCDCIDSSWNNLINSTNTLNFQLHLLSRKVVLSGYIMCHIMVSTAVIKHSTKFPTPVVVGRCCGDESCLDHDWRKLQVLTAQHSLSERGFGLGFWLGTEPSVVIIILETVMAINFSFLAF